MKSLSEHYKHYDYDLPVASDDSVTITQYCIKYLEEELSK
jgi:hypothetical protein